MSGIPPAWLGSIIQTQGAQKNAAEQAAKESASQAERTPGGSFADKLQDVIEASDRDSQVYSDAEGTGSQGRPSEEPADQEQPQDSDSTAETDEPTGGLDVEA